MGSIKEFLQHWDLLGFVIAAIISLLISLIFKGIKNLVIMKRKPYNISRQTINRTVYDNRRDGDFTITVSYKDKVCEDSLTLLRIRLLNDGENDINYIRQCAKPISIEISEAVETIDIVLEPSNKDMESSIEYVSDNKFDLTWSLLKRDEFIDLVIVAKGKNLSAEQVKIAVRAEGIEKIKSPEYRVWPQLWPVLSAILIMSVVAWFVMPGEVTFIPYIPQNVFWTGMFLLLAPELHGALSRLVLPRLILRLGREVLFDDAEVFEVGEFHRSIFTSCKSNIRVDHAGISSIFVAP